MTKPERYTVDLSAYPDLVVIYLGMRVEEPRGVETLEALGPQIRAAVDEEPQGLLLHEELIYSQEPLHVGMRQYWRDFDSLKAWSLALPHKEWWTDYLRDRGGTSFWHETYFRPADSSRCTWTWTIRRSASGCSRPGQPRPGRCSPPDSDGTPRRTRGAES